MGFKRERHPFVFSPEMIYIISNTDDTPPPTTTSTANTTNSANSNSSGSGNNNTALQYAGFESICIQAHAILRKHSDTLLVMCILMLPAGLPELTKREDIIYVRDMLMLNSNDKVISYRLRDELKGAVSSLSRQVDNWIHNWIHKN